VKGKVTLNESQLKEGDMINSSGKLEGKDDLSYVVVLS